MKKIIIFYCCFLIISLSGLTAKAEENIPLWRISPSSIDLGRLESNTRKDFSFTFSNPQKIRAEWEIVSSVQWLIVNKKKTIEGRSNEKMMVKEGENLKTAAVETMINGCSLNMIYGKTLLEGTLEGNKSLEIHCTADTRDLPDGAYQGNLTVRAEDGAMAEVKILFKVISLLAVKISPVQVSLPVSQEVRFRAIALWSDGMRSDISEEADAAWKVSDSSIGFFAGRKPIFVAGNKGQVEISMQRGNLLSNTALIDVTANDAPAVLSVLPHEINFGKIGPGEFARDYYDLENLGAGTLVCVTAGPDEWFSADEDVISLKIGNTRRFLNIGVESVAPGDNAREGSDILYPVQVVIGSGLNDIVYKKFLPVGIYRERMELYSEGGNRTVFFSFEITPSLSRPLISIDPAGFNFEEVEAGKRIVSKIKVRNQGQGVLSWKALLMDKQKPIDGKVYRDDTMTVGAENIRFFPEVGTTTNETDYVNVLIDTKSLSPGLYNERIVFQSNGGDESVEFAFIVKENKREQLIQVYRHMKDGDCILISEEDRQGSAASQNNGEGKAVFKLFRKDTAGTTPFYRWFDPVRKIHYYSYDSDESGRLHAGYIMQGSIGNIATSKLSNTRELYRWYNAVQKNWFYSTDPKGEGYRNQGYAYDGIAGYVR